MRSFSLSAADEEESITEEQEDLLHEAWKAVHESRQAVEAMHENLVAKFGAVIDKENVKRDLGDDTKNGPEIRDPRNNDRVQTDQVSSPVNEERRPDAVLNDDHQGLSNDGNKKRSKSTSVGPAKPTSHKEIKREIRRLKAIAKHEKSEHRRHPNHRRERSSVEPMSAQMFDLAGEEPKNSRSKERSRSTLLKPSEQVNEKSYLGKAFKDLSETEGDTDPDDSSSELSSSEGGTSASGSGGSSPTTTESDSCSSSGDDSSSNNSSSSDGSPKSQRENKKRKSKKKTKKSKKAKGKSKAKYSTLKPTPPDKYNGYDNPIKYVRFINQSNSYLKRGKVDKRDSVAEISNFLTDNPYDCYLSEVSMELRKWNLPRFFRALFNACFPPNFRILQQDKLDEFKQGSLSAHEYATQLKNLYRIVGYAHK
ncbi:hypothetical protein DXG01_002811 [Tephrocybe rancida]|nr:hypothetical protein DXG01_002811 [Tephrocybe rancida]